MKQTIIAALLLLPLPLWAAVQNGRQMEQVANQFLQARQGEDGYNYQLKLQARKPAMPACGQPLQAAWPAGNARPQQSVTLSCVDQGWSLNLPVVARELQLVLVTTRLLRAGDIVQADDVRLAAVNNRSQLSQGIRDQKLVLGQMVRTSLPPGTMLTESQVRSPYVVKMNQPVKLLIQGDGFAVSSDATALGNAGAGERVNVRVGNGKVVSATAEPDGSVTVQMP
ncbi:flagellar basal body P-ring formation chaperone FlgA [Vogesella oryzae]|uniref:flagellar basal body P-ring formation chaperone FlgA n=1 Tax=Vogesella oryzae TaxID=1735285 RepID=UPI001582B0D8|nr:flagellar basal body P-ring formation chaperone FlgA [Vogesella oryzae]